MMSAQRSGFIRSLSPTKIEHSTTCFERHPHGSISFKELSSRLNLKCDRNHCAQTLSFRPEIHEKPMEIYSEGLQKTRISKEEIMERLIEDSTLKVRERMMIKVQKEKEMEKECTFRPQVSDFSKYLKNLQVQDGEDEQIFTKLFEEAKEKQENKVQFERMKKEKELQQIQALQRNLKSNKTYLLNREKHNLDPLYKRIKQIVSKKIQQKKELTIKFSKDLSFGPKINTKSQQIFNKKKQKEEVKKNVVERLLEEHEKKKKRKEKLMEEYEEKKRKELPFAPQNSNNFIAFSKDNFLERLKQKLTNHCAHGEEISSFIPQINHLSDLITKHSRGKQNREDQVNRMAYEPLEKREHLRKKIEDQMYEECRFNPQINEISANSLCRKKKHKCEKPVEQTYPFQPKINQQSRMIRSRSTESARRMKRRKKQVEYRCEAEYQEMKQCTFRPKVNEFRHEGCRTLEDVEGVSIYMGHSARAQQKRVVEKERQEKLFHLEKRYDERMKKNKK